VNGQRNVPSKRSSKRSTLVWPIGTLAVLITLKTAFEHTEKVQYLENKTYELLQGQIVHGGTTKRPDVLVVDISKIKKEPCSPNWECTPREPIQNLIDVFAVLGAKSIGVDVDFSPDEGQLIHPNDKEFFEWCLHCSKEKKVPIVLGVFRSAQRPEEWLSDDCYMRLAGFIGVRRGGEYWPDRATYWITAGNGWPLPSISAALARVNLIALIQGKKSLWGWAVQPTSIIDFSPMEQITREVEHHTEPGPYWDDQDKIAGRIIILGDANPKNCDPEKDQDCFHVTGVSSGVHGVYLHACAANTIAGGKPIYQLTLLGRITIDLFLALLIFGLVKSSSWLHSRLGDSIPGMRLRLNVKFTFLLILFVFVGSVVLVRWTRLLWTDFVLVCVVLFLQMVVELFGARPTPSSWVKPDTTDS
jgi:hypothetical protein